jgi:hypothetical protein
MPYGGKALYAGKDIQTIPAEDKNLVKSALTDMVTRGWYHTDLKWDHVLVKSPTKKGKAAKKQIILCDQTRTKRITQPEQQAALTQMMNKLQLQ